LFEAAFVGNIEVDVIVNVDTMGPWRGVTMCVEDALVEGVTKGPCKPWPSLPAE
jgi:hypothetical protein